MNRPQFDPESALVGAILLAPEAYWRVADVVSEEDFARRDLGKLWGHLRPADQARRRGGCSDHRRAPVAQSLPRSRRAKSSSLTTSATRQ